MSKKFLIAVPYTNDSAQKINQLLYILAHKTDAHNEYCDLLIYIRFDSINPSEQLIHILKEKFENVYLMQAKPRIMNLLVPNFIVPYLFKQIKNELTIGKKTLDWEEYKAVLLTDENTCPISNDWMKKLSSEWDENECHCMGSWLSENSVHGDMTNCVGHINQNAMYSLDIIKNCDEISQQPNWSSWDEYYARVFLNAGWQGTYAIRYFNRPLDTHELTEIAITCSAVLINGVPDTSAKKYFISLK
jgi:hypothetical protein